MSVEKKIAPHIVLVNLGVLCKEKLDLNFIS